MNRLPTVASMLRQRAHSGIASEIAVRFYENGRWIEWSWADYWRAAQKAASYFSGVGVRRGDHVVILVPEVRAATAALFGLWTIGAVPIQIGLPFRLQDRGAFMLGLVQTAEQLEARFLITTPALRPSIPPAGITMITTAGIEEHRQRDEIPDLDDPTRPAFLQLTSGSTAHPRAVIVPHDRLMLHLRSMSESLPSHPDSVGVSWLPLHHDMGLLGGLLFPFYNGFPACLIATGDFQARPGLWLETMSRFQGTITAAPPSGYAICLQLAPRFLRAGLDLSRWECAMVGAEPIPASLLGTFAGAFAPLGFRANAFFPVYGLAEATVAVTFPALLANTVLDRVERTELEISMRATPAAGLEGSIEFVGVGKPIPGTRIKVAGADGETLPERSIGEICVRSESLALGYFGDEPSTSAVFRDGWLYTGDLGHIADGTLFITGRKKEMIIKGGQNLIPSVLEEIAASVAGIRGGAVAAVGVRSDALATELVCIVAEARGSPGGEAGIAADVRQALKNAGVAVDRVLLLPPKSLPKTTSGKLQRGVIAKLAAAQIANAGT